MNEATIDRITQALFCLHAQKDLILDECFDDAAIHEWDALQAHIDGFVCNMDADTVDALYELSPI